MCSVFRIVSDRVSEHEILIKNRLFFLTFFTFFLFLLKKNKKILVCTPISQTCTWQTGLLHSCVHPCVSSSTLEQNPSPSLCQCFSIGQNLFNAKHKVLTLLHSFSPPSSPLICIQGKGVCILIFTSGI